MESLASGRCFTFFPTLSSSSSHSCNYLLPLRHRPILSVSRATRSVEVAEEDVLQAFFRERELTGDFISKAYDMIWQREVTKFNDTNYGSQANAPQQLEEVKDSVYEGGFLKLTRTQEWVLGDDNAPYNKKARAKAMQNDSDKRKRLNLLKYEALKRELLFLTIGIGTACSGYCLVAFSFEAAVSYAAGVLFSCLYLQLLFQQSDNLSRESVPQIFMQKKEKKIGIRSDDLTDFFERTLKGIGIALSSPRLVIPAAIYGLWGLSQHFTSDFFDFQLVPGMFGIFAYKAAALVQVYRDNEDLLIIFPESSE